MNDTVTMLPSPHLERWRPTRAGLIALWRYWDETFTFHRGRLLLRGPNGSGKSMALELLLPFLLDADASPARLTSAAKSRGGLFERVMTGTDEPTRAGFAWVEFRRGDEIFTAGVRLRASAATHKVDHDFFTTSKEIGTELRLLDDDRVPLSRKGLSEAIGASGRVHSSGEEHRAAVRSTLFPGFSADQYASLITGLLALRKEKLSQNLDLLKLSDILSEALPPIDEHDLAVVAEGFERLDRRRAELHALEAELAEVKALAARQRDYARAVLAGLAVEVRSAETRRDGVTRAEREARDELAEAKTHSAALVTEAASLEARLETIDVEIDALKASDSFREGADLEALRAEVRRLQKLVERDASLAEASGVALGATQEQLELAEGHLGETVVNRDLAAADMRSASVPVAAEAIIDEASQLGDLDEGELVVAAWVHTREQLVSEVRKAITAHGAAIQQRTFAEERVADDSETVEARDSSHDAAVAAHLAALGAYDIAVSAWVASCTSVGPDRLTQSLPPTPREPAMVQSAAQQVSADLQAEYAVARQAIESRRKEISDERARLLEERAEVAQGRLVEPAAPPWRGDRSDRSGAPLWRLVDLMPGFTEDVDRLEAALTAAGLIDAWITPDGRVDLVDPRADVTLSTRPAVDSNLGELLVPLADGPVPEHVVADILRSVPIARSVDPADAAQPEVVLGLDGTFRLGTAFGRGPAVVASVLGSAAQERRRIQRLAELDGSIATAEVGLQHLDREVDALDRAKAATDADLAAMPASVPVVAASLEVATATARLAEAEDRLAVSRKALLGAEDEVRRSLRALTTVGARHQLPTNDDALTTFATALRSFADVAVTWARRRRELVGAEGARDRAVIAVERAANDDRRAAENLRASRRDADEVTTRVATLESTIGVEYRQILSRIASLDSDRRDGRDRQRKLSEERPELERRVGRLESELAKAELARTRADEERANAHRRFVAAFTDGLGIDASVAVSGPLDGVSNILTAGRAVAVELEGVAHDEQAIERASARLEERLHLTRASVGGRVDLSRELTDESWWVLRAMTSGVRRSAGELAATLGRELDQGRAELLVEEERLFEQVLAGSVRRALAERIRLANRLVDGINTQLAKVRTAAGGVEVRLRWEVDPEQLDAVKAARALLLRDPADLTNEEAASLQAFVRARVDQARAELEVNAPWEARLRETLDYRAWHRFSLQLGHRDWEGLQPATPRRLQRLSTGERSIALHLPMLASIAAHYVDDEGVPSVCPRLILLDELFAGVDTTNRAQLFGTFTAWDLDAVFTSDHEWCQYATLNGIAIHHLHPPTGNEPVTSTRFTWDGRHRFVDPPAA